MLYVLLDYSCGPALFVGTSIELVTLILYYLGGSLFIIHGPCWGKTNSTDHSRLETLRKIVF